MSEQAHELDRNQAAGSFRLLAEDLALMAPYVDEEVPQLVECAIRRGEGVLAANGALSVRTGQRTGRSPKDRFIVDEPGSRDHIDWGIVNRPFDAAAFENLWNRVVEHVSSKGDAFISFLRAGADPVHSIALRVITEFAWHTLFARQLFIRPAKSDPHDAEWTVLNAPSYEADPARDGTSSDGAVIIDLAKQRILLCGMHYAGEMKKAVFSVMNYLMPEQGILPMHCAANVGEDGDVALFFGLSGTGKTTLSADPTRFLIGDDEHGWNDQGIFNFEGGCYAKCIQLTQEREPVIWNAIRFGAVMENVVLDGIRHVPCYDDESITQNTRVAYPREYIEMRMPGNRAGHPQAIIFLTCDLFGVLPPVAILSKQQAAYYFLSGYTALVGSTEVGQIDDVKPTFSACFGSPFFPRKPREYADLLMRKIDQHNSPVYLVNTGWTGGAYGEDGRRFSIATTRALIHAIVRGGLQGVETQQLPGLNLTIPRHVPGVDTGILNPRNGWHDKNAYDRQAHDLIQRFLANFERFQVSREIRSAGPRL
jgi:phosphoenolpyruvate carboxykinase (ATP)